jgi:hypothetical protein
MKFFRGIKTMQKILLFPKWKQWHESTCSKEIPEECTLLYHISTRIIFTFTSARPALSTKQGSQCDWQKPIWPSLKKKFSYFRLNNFRNFLNQLLNMGRKINPNHLTKSLKSNSGQEGNLKRKR